MQHSESSSPTLPERLPHGSPRRSLTGWAANADVLVAAVSAGAGHVRAAQAISDELRRRQPERDVRDMDLAHYMPRWFKRLYIDGYHVLASHTPLLFQVLFEVTDAEPMRRRNQGALAQFEKLLAALEDSAMRGLVNTLIARPPSAIINTHFLLPALLARLAREPLQIRQSVCITDFDVHRAWVSPDVDAWFVANDLCRETLHALGVDRRRVHVTGIPIRAAFAQRPDPIASRQLFGFPEDVPVVLLSAGTTFVSRGFRKMLYGCLRSAPQACIAVMVGRNRRLTKRVSELAQDRPNLRVVPFTDKMPELMAAADLLVTKPGGLTTSEALAMGLPMVLINPIPGQEDRNADYLQSEGVAVRSRHHRSVPIQLRMILSDESRRLKMRDRALAISRPNAAQAVADWIG